MDCKVKHYLYLVKLKRKYNENGRNIFSFFYMHALSVYTSSFMIQ